MRPIDADALYDKAEREMGGEPVYFQFGDGTQGWAIAERDVDDIVLYGPDFDDHTYPDFDFINMEYNDPAWKGVTGVYEYKADYEDNPGYVWTPSIHMPRGAARIFLRVTDIRVERLQDITDDGIVRDFDFCAEALKIMNTQQKDVACMALWDSTIKPADRAIYGWNANPWVWVIEFKQFRSEGESNG